LKTARRFRRYSLSRVGNIRAGNSCRHPLRESGMSGERSEGNGVCRQHVFPARSAAGSCTPVRRTCTSLIDTPGRVEANKSVDGATGGVTCTSRTTAIPGVPTGRRRRLGNRRARRDPDRQLHDFRAAGGPRDDHIVVRMILAAIGCSRSPKEIRTTPANRRRHTGANKIARPETSP